MASVRDVMAGMTAWKAGNVVFVNREGSPYIRQAPEYSKSSWTMNQKQHRERFKKVAEFCRQFRLNIIRPIWNLLPGKASGYGKFLKANMPAFGRDGSLTDKSMLHFSNGTLPLPYHLSVARVEGAGNTIEASWENDALIPFTQKDDDLLYVAAAGEVFKGPFETGYKRQMGGCLIALPSEAGTVDAVYLFFASGDRHRYSPDRYIEV